MHDPLLRLRKSGCQLRDLVDSHRHFALILAGYVLVYLGVDSQGRASCSPEASATRPLLALAHRHCPAFFSASTQAQPEDSLVRISLRVLCKALDPFLASVRRSTRKKTKDLEVTRTGHKLDGRDPTKIIGCHSGLSTHPQHSSERWIFYSPTCDGLSIRRVHV